MAPIASTASPGSSRPSRSSSAAPGRRLGVNFACYIGHCNLRRWVMGEDGSARAATDAEIVAMGRLLRRGDGRRRRRVVVSTHASTHIDGDNHPVPSRFAEPDELLALAEELGPGQPGHRSPTCLAARWAGSTGTDMDLLSSSARVAAYPSSSRDSGAATRSTPPAPGGTWPWSSSQRPGRRVRRCTRCCWPGRSTAPSLDRRDQPSTRGCRRGTQVRRPHGGRRWPCSATPRSGTRCATPSSTPTATPPRGSTLPPPHWDVALRRLGGRLPNSTSSVGRSIARHRRPSRAWPRPTPCSTWRWPTISPPQFRWVTETASGWRRCVRPSTTPT